MIIADTDRFEYEYHYTMSSMNINTMISMHNVNKLEKVLLDYKQRLLQDFQQNFVSDKITYEELENKFLKKKEIKPLIKRSLDIDEEKCMARIWIEGHGGIQCRYRKKNGDYCLKHYQKQNYGRIDESIDI